ncbi:MAG: hypothetical protein ACRDSP_25085 [Pseudonocardiaceae bacterium]
MSAPAQRLLTVTDTQGIAHLVTDESMATGHRAGRFLAVCGQRVLTASLTTPQRGCCRVCAQRRTAR